MFFQAEDGIRDLVRSRGLGEVYKRQLWDGRLRLPPCEDDEETAAIREFNSLCYGHPDLESTIVPLRDGVSVARRIR